MQVRSSGSRGSPTERDGKGTGIVSRATAVLTVSILAASVLLQGCSAESDEGTSGTSASRPRPIAPCPGGSCLGEALSLLPDGPRLVFGDRGGAAKRLGLDDIGADSADDQIATYLADFDGPAATSWARDLTKMTEGDAAFSELDVRWWAALGRGTAYRMLDGLDLDAVADDLLDAGYTESENHGHRRFSAGASVADPRCRTVSSISRPTTG
jgi:hypothetical protein